MVIDRESACWKEAPPPGPEHDMIEIGICVLDASLNTGQILLALLKQVRANTALCLADAEVE